MTIALAHLDEDDSLRRPVAQRVVDEVADGAAERTGVAAHGHGSRGVDGHARPCTGQRELVEADGLRRKWVGRIFACEGEQVIEQPRKARGVLLDVGEDLGIRAMLGDVGGIAAQRGQRGSQLVGGIGDEAALGLARALERCEHRVQRLREGPDLVARPRGRESPRGVARVSDLARRGGEARERAQRPARQHKRDRDR